MSSKTKKEKPEKGGLINTLKAIFGFLGRAYIWSGLLLGFIWSFSTPFILTTFQEPLKQLPQEAISVLFFPMVLAFHIIIPFAGPEKYIDPFLLWGFSMLIGLITGAIITYCIHLICSFIKNWRQKRGVHLKPNKKRQKA